MGRQSPSDGARTSTEASTDAPPITRIAVTGASGFLGRHVLAALSRTGLDVIAHARTPRSDHAAADRLQWSHFDIATAPEDAFDRLQRPDVVIHLAWDGLPNYHALRHIETELPTQQRFLRGLVAAGLRRLVVAGTCFEYGMQSGCLSEDTPTRPSNAYGFAKDSLRRTLASPERAATCDLRWLRLFYLYGSGQAPTSLYSQFRAAVARGERAFDMSAGDQLRDFMKAEDAAAAIVEIARRPCTPRILNVCSGTPVSVRSLVERWRNDMAANIALNFGALPYAAHEPPAFWGDDRRLRALLGPAAVRTA